MTRTTFDPTTLPQAELTSGYNKADDPLPAPAWRRGAAEAAGGLWSTAEDMGRWVAAQLDAWPARDEAEHGSLPRASLREAHTPAVALGLSAVLEDDRVKARSRSVGLAWHVRETCEYERLVEHDGGTEGHRASLVFAPERGFGFVILANSGDTHTDTLQEELLADAVLLVPRAPVPSPRTSEALTELAATLSNVTTLTYEELFTDLFRSQLSMTQYKELGRRLTELHGVCRVDRALSVRGPFEGKFLLGCDRGRIEVDVTVQAARDSVRVGAVRFRSVGFAPAKETLRAAAAILALYAKWDSTRYKEIFSRPESERELHATVDAMKAKVGSCRLEKRADQVLTGNGRFRAVLPLECEKHAKAELEVDLDRSGKVATSSLRLRKFRPSRCGGPAVAPELE